MLYLQMLNLLLFALLILCGIAMDKCSADEMEAELVLARFKRLPTRPTGPVSDHGRLCNALWRPNLIEPLSKCESNCAENYECTDDAYCCPTKELVCSLPESSGHETELDQHFGRYAYSPELKTCIKFSYFGNGGNFNNFLKHHECMHFCRPNNEA